MAIIKEEYYIGNRKFIKTFSNEYRYLVRDGIKYIEACDPAEFNREYIEGELIDIQDDDYEIAGKILIGVDRNDNYTYDNEEDFAIYKEISQEYINIGKMFLEVNDNDHS